MLTYFILVLALMTSFMLGSYGIHRIKAGRIIFGVGCIISASCFLIMGGCIATVIATTLISKVMFVAIAVAIGVGIKEGWKKKLPQSEV